MYWDPPFYAYQDKIISFCAALYALVFYEAMQDPVRYSSLAVKSLCIATAGLSLVNMSSDLAHVLTPKNSIVYYWVETAMIGGIACWLAYWKAKAGISN